VNVAPSAPGPSNYRTPRITSPPNTGRLNDLKSSKTSPRREHMKEASRATSASALPQPVTEPSAQGGGTGERGWKSLWSLDVSIEEEKKRDAL
jgi:hypothetical protein